MEVGLVYEQHNGKRKSMEIGLVYRVNRNEKVWKSAQYMNNKNKK